MRSSYGRVLLTFLILVGVGADSSFAGPQKSKGRRAAAAVKQDESEKPPFVGMTKAQATARYGEPKTRSVTDKGEIWVYVLNYGEVVGKAFIPFNFKPTPIRTGALTFGPDGKVKEFRWDAETKG